MHRIDTRMYISRRDVFRKGAKPFRNCFPSPPRGKPGNLLILDTSHWFTSVTRLVQTILSLSPSLVSIISLDLPFISTNISRPLPLFSTYLPTPFSFRSKLFEEERSKKRKKNSVVGKRVEKIELAFVSSSGFSGFPGETRLWKIIIARGGVGSFRRA